MKIAAVRLAGASVAVLLIQLAIVSTIAAKYVYQRWTCPRVWTRTAAYDPQLVMRGRYLGLQLLVDGCESTLPSARSALFPRNVDGTVRSPGFRVESAMTFPARLAVRNNKLIAVHLRDAEDPRHALNLVSALAGSACADMRLVDPVNFYIPEHATVPPTLTGPNELWIEVTIPPNGPPRPIQLALKHENAWLPLAYR